MKPTLFITLSLLVSSLGAAEFIGCAETKKEALAILSGNINSRIATVYESTTVEKNDSVKSKILAYTNASSSLSLVNIKYKSKGKEQCAYVEKEDQVKNTKKLLKAAMLYSEDDLPKNIDAKIQKLEKWLEDIKQLSYLLPVFLENSSQAQLQLNKKEKRFSDLYSESIAKSNSLFFKSCEKEREDAKEALNKKLFKNSSKKEEEGGFFSSITSIFSSDEKPVIDLFNEQIIYTQSDKKECAMIKKEELRNVAQKMYADIARLNEKSFSKDPKKRYKEIENYYEQLRVTKDLIALFPETYKSRDFDTIDRARELLADLQKKTNPQYVIFNIKDGQNISISLDSRAVKNNEKIYIKKGEHTYKITAKEKCPIEGSFDVDLFEDEAIEDDFSDMNYPSVLFVTDKTPNIVVDGALVKPNIVTPIKKCSGSVRYVVKFAGQSESGSVDTEAGDKNTIVLNLLTPEELSVFNDAKTKYFETNSGSKFSESLTPTSSEVFNFVVTESPSHGKLDLHSRGSFKYQADEEYVGEDSFEYVIKTEGKRSAPKLVNIKVNPSLKVKVKNGIKDIQKKKDELLKSAADTNITKKVDTLAKTPKEETKKIVVEKKKIETVVQEAPKVDVESTKYKRFKVYVQSKMDDPEKLNALKKKYKDMYEQVMKDLAK